MSVELILFYCFASLALLSGAFVILSKNPIHSVLFLIVVFLNASGLLILLEVEFLAMLFLIVYVGAIAILFLFVVMMLNIKALDENISRYLPMGGFLALIFLIETFIILQGDLISVSADPRVFSWNEQLSVLTNIEAIGDLFYTYYFYLFLVAGMILLVAMIGAIVLTMHKRAHYQTQNVTV